MSLLSSFTKKSKLNATIKQTAQARKSEGITADGLFKAAYQGYADILLDDPLRAETLYNWGFALFHQAQTKTGDEAAKLFQDAIDRFAFCQLINPDYLGAAINSGVAYMDYARLKKAMPHDRLYELAKQQFERANAIQAATASYNLACIYGLRGDKEACLKALESSRSRATLPDVADILSDPDMAGVKEQEWFLAFIEVLSKKPEPEVEEKKIDPTASKWRVVERKVDVEDDEPEPEAAEEVAVEAAATEEEAK
jgi:tetratricopeptide (TPR) repeat protein